jgi:dTDP-4-amino-4,6-dideoxygalactose transaminase
MAERKIPFNKPDIDRSVLEIIGTVIDSGKLSGDGSMGKDVEKQIETLFSIRHALLTTSGTHALEIAAMMLRLKTGDEVLLPSFTFVSTANAILRAGGRPVFCDINDQTLTIDLDDLARRVTKKTRSVIAVHYAGIAAEMDEVMQLAQNNNLFVIEDAAQGVNARYKGKFLGSIGHCGAYSFHDTKNYTCGEGGAFVTKDDEIARYAEVLREKGTNRANFLRGEVDKYTWIDQGSSYVLSDVLAAILKCQLNDLDRIQHRRREIHHRYISGLTDLAGSERLRLPVIPPHCESNFHIFYILLKNEDERNRLLKSMKERGVQTTFHYVPLHSSPFAQRVLGTSDQHLPVTDSVSSRLLRLPIYPQLSDQDVDYIIQLLHELLR